MRIVLEKGHKKSKYSDEYKLSEYWKVGNNNIELLHKCETFKEYKHLLRKVALGYINLDKITDFIGISKEEILKDIGVKDEDKFK